MTTTDTSKEGTASRRSHPGLCLNLLDEPHKALVRELAFLAMALQMTSTGCVQIFDNREEHSCRCCLAMVEVVDGEPVRIEHRVDCMAMQAKRLLEGDSALGYLAVSEMNTPVTESGKVFREGLDEAIRFCKQRMEAEGREGP